MSARIPILLGALAAIAITAFLILPRAEQASAGSPTRPGDVNCDGRVNSIDAALILQYSAGLLDSLPCPENADVNGDGSIDAIDAWLLLQFCACPIYPLPPPISTPTGPPPERPTATPTPPGFIGDVNCDSRVNAVDAAFILQFVAGLIGPLACEQNADVNRDGIINPIDAVLLMQLTTEPWFP